MSRLLVAASWVGFGFFLTLVSQPIHARDGFMLRFVAPIEPIKTTLTLVDRAKQLGATHFNIPVALLQEDEAATEMDWFFGKQQTFEFLHQIVPELHRRQLTVGLIPFHLANNWTWRGFFRPSDFDAWGRSHRKIMLDLANVTRLLNIHELAVGTELNHLYVGPPSATDYWSGLMNELRALLPQTSIFLIANWDQWNQIPDWSASDYIGLSSYFPLTNHEKEDTSASMLEKTWNRWAKALTKLSRQHARALYFAEVGYPSMRSAASEPWRMDPPSAHDPQLQKRLFDAFGKIWRTSTTTEDLAHASLHRAILWDLSASETPETDLSYVIFGKPAQESVSRFMRASAGAGSHP